MWRLLRIPALTALGHPARRKCCVKQDAGNSRPTRIYKPLGQSFGKMGFYHRINGLTHFFREYPLRGHWNTTMKTYMCVICGFIYDEATGLPQEGISPGTRWEDVPLTWRCPECGAGKEDFEMMEL